MKHILVVEDDKNAGFLLVDHLTSEGYKVSLAKDGEEAWLLINCNKFDLYILDIMLPKMDGISLAKKIREQNKIPILIGGHAMQMEDPSKFEGKVVGDVSLEDITKILRKIHLEIQ